MKKKILSIEIVSSSAKTLSSMSDESRTAIQAVLARHYKYVSITMINTVADLEALADRQPDLVFLGMKYLLTDNGKIWISNYLEDRGIPHTGSDQHAHELELNKQLAKQRVLDEGFATSRYFVARQDRQVVPTDIDFTFPVFIKPPNRGGGVGIDSASVAHNFDALYTKVQSISNKYCSDSLIEEYLSGREFSVAVLKNLNGNEFTVMPIELVAEPDVHGSRMLSNEVKCSNTELVLEVNDPAVRSQVTTLALNVFKALGARDYGRIDIRMDASGAPHFLEANLIPSIIGGYGSFPKACLMNQGLDYEPMILQIVELGLLRANNAEEDAQETFTDFVLPEISVSLA